MKVEAAVLEAFDKPLQQRELDLEGPRQGEVLVKMVSASICHTDVSGIHGEYGQRTTLPMVLGHEGAGVVEDVGEGVTKVKKGDHVVLSVVVHCGRCRNCHAGRYWSCERFNQIAFGGGLQDGSRRLSYNGKDVSHFFAISSFARHAVVPENIAIRVPDDAPLEKLSPLSCGVQTGSGAAMNIGIEPGASVAVFGCGGVGLSAIMGARVVGAGTIIGIDPVDERLSLARELGATDTINPKVANVVDEMKRLTGTGVDYAIECVGREDAIAQALGGIRSYGTVVLVGIARVPKLSLDFFSLFRATVRGCTAGFSNSDVSIPAMVKLYQQGRFPFDKMSPKTYAFEDINAGVQDMLNGTVVKPLLRF